jgi:uroporphyrinogen decarboxylase
MRQAGRYLPEYRATRQQAGSFLELCYNPDLATEVTLQPIRRFGFDAAILFADILLVPHGLGRRLWFEVGEGPRLDPLTSLGEIEALASDEEMHGHLAPVYETVSRVRSALPRDATLIGFAGAPWTVATYMIAGRGRDEQRAALEFMKEQPQTFEKLMLRLETATISYLGRQISAGAEVVKIFDSWARALAFDHKLYDRWCVEPVKRILSAIKSEFPDVGTIAFPRGSGHLYKMAARSLNCDCLAFDEDVDFLWAKKNLLSHCAVQGNLAPHHLVSGGIEFERAVNCLKETFFGECYVFNLGHGITPDADPKNVERLLKMIRN